MKLSRTQSIVVFAVALAANLAGVVVWGRQALQTGQFTPSLAISILLCLVIAPYLIMALLRKPD
ncbi:MAG: hypothetical protein K1X35_12280 [Caulobacteraceae bacterium]|nr:hypothetical protein [Caulobacteraceae bacterium]